MREDMQNASQPVVIRKLGFTSTSTTDRAIKSHCLGTTSTLRRFRSRIDLHGSGHASHQADAIRHLIDVDAHRHALRKAHPGKDRIYRGEPRRVRLYVRDVDAAGDAADMARKELQLST